MRDEYNDYLQWYVRIVFYAGLGAGLFVGLVVGLVVGTLLP